MMRPMIRLAIAGLAGSAALPAAAQQVEVSPYIEASQVLVADLDDGDVLTYSSVAVGVDASIRTQRIEVQANYQYERRFAWDDDVADDDVHTGLVRGSVLVAQGLTLEGGALATRVRADIRGESPGVLAGNVGNVSQLYAAYAGPTLARRVGPGTLNAAYRYGYTKVEVPDVPGIDPTQPRLDYYDDASSHLATASYGVQSGVVAPVGFSVGGLWQREAAGQLDQRFESRNLRGDLVLPIDRSLAIVGGVGYEHIEISQRDALVDVDGFPVVDRNGRFITDPASPRRLAFETDGVFWDAGLLWKPSARTTLEARVGRRYDSWTYIGSLSLQTGPRSGIQVGVYDSVQSFGRQVGEALSALPTAWEAATGDPFNDNYNGCVFGIVGSATGGCLNGVLQSAASANYRARGVDAVYSMTSGSTQIGIGIGYANRRFYAPPAPVGISIDGVTDQSFYAQVFASRTLDRVSGVTGNLFLNYLESGLPGAPATWNTGATGSYYRDFGRLRAQASAGIYNSEVEDIDSDLSAQALLGLGYRF